MPTFSFTSPDGKTYEVAGPEGATKEQAFQVLQQRIGPQKAEKIHAAYPMEPALETAMAMGSSVVAKPIADIAGTGAAIYGAAKNMPQTIQGKPAEGTGTEPAAVHSAVQNFLTFQPKTEEGKKLLETFAPIGEWWNRVSHAAGEKVAPPHTSGPLQSALGYATTGAVEQAPMLAGGKAPEAAGSASRFLRTEGEHAMQRALKPNIGEVRKGQDVTAINAMLEQGLNVSRGGLRKMQDKVANLNDEIATLIQNSPATIDRNAAASYVQDTVNRFQNQVAPLMDLAAIEKVYNEFLNINPRDIPVQKAQEIKRGTYQQLKTKSYGELKTAETEAQKDIARGIKDKIAEVVQDVRPLNAEESKLLTALPMVERRVLQHANEHLIGFSWLTHSPEKMVAFMADRSPLFWSLVGRMMDKSSRAVTGKTGPYVGTEISTAASAAEERRRLRAERVRQRQEEERNAAQER